MFLLLAGLAGMAYGAGALCMVRWRTGGEETGIAMIGAAALGGGTVAVLVHVATTYVPLLDAHTANWPQGVAGIVIGIVWAALVYVGARFLLDFCGVAYRWACRREPAGDETVELWLRRHGADACGFAFALVLLVVCAHYLGLEDPQSNPLSWALVVACISIPPLYSTWVSPWLLYLRARTLDAGDFREIHQWLAELGRTRKLPKFHLRVQEGPMINAKATGGLRRYFIILGAGLVERMSTAHLKVVLAHEIGHVLNRDTTWRTVVSVLICASLHVLYFTQVVRALDSLFLEALAVSIGAPIFWVVLPGLWQRHAEYQADRKAAELIGDPEAVAEALLKLSEVTNSSIDLAGWPHPPMRARVEAVRQLAAGPKTEPDKPR